MEQQNFSIRKRTLEYDDVMNKQRSVIYELRGEVLSSASPHEKILDIFNDLILSQCEGFLDSPKVKECRPGELAEALMTAFPIAVTAEELGAFAGKPEDAAQQMYARVAEAYEVKCAMEPPASLAFLERQVVLSCIDQQWQEYLRAMDELRHGVSLRAYGQRDPLVEYKREAFQMFEALVEHIKTDVAHTVFRATASIDNFDRLMHGGGARRQQTIHQSVSLLGAANAEGMTPFDDNAQSSVAVPAGAAANFDAALDAMGNASATPQPVRRDEPRVGRNDPCPCGSGKKHKKCCGQSV